MPLKRNRKYNVLHPIHHLQTSQTKLLHGAAMAAHRAALATVR